MIHKHIWKYVERGFGEPPKNNLPEPLLFEGHIAACECTKKMFFPDNPNYLPQELIDQPPL